MFLRIRPREATASLIRLVLVVVAAVGLAVASTLAQVAVVERNVNLRVDPSTGQEPIRLLTPGVEVEVLDNAQKLNNYYHVITAAGEEGWVWANNVELDPNRDLVPAVGLEVFHGCPMEGNAIPQWVKDLNRLKNRYQAPQQSDFDPNVTLHTMLATGDDTSRWNDGRAAEITGHVLDVKVGGVETANCRATDPNFRDTHVEIVVSAADSGKTRRVIVEVTPRWREMMKAQNQDWTTSALEISLEGKKVRFRGWLFFDDEHDDEAENTRPGRAANWRATAWEIHPLTSIEVIQ